MTAKFFLRHRMRDIDAALRLDNKVRPFIYIFLRQFFKLLNVKEDNLKALIKDNKSKLFGYRFLTRKNTIDFLFCSKYYETETTNYLRSIKGNTFVDVGGHIGRFAILASRNFRKVVVFEPQPSNYESLKSNIAINKITNITAVNAAVSDKEDVVSLSNLSPNTGWVYISDSGEIKVRCATLADFAKQYNVPFNEIDIIMIDAEGHELEVLKGAAEIFSEASPQILMESFDVTKIEGILKDYGYKKVMTLDSYNHLFKKDIDTKKIR